MCWCIKSVKNTLWKGFFSHDCILTIDEMYLPKSPQYQSGECVEEGNLYKGIFAFMVVGLKESVPFAVHTIPEATVNGLWLAENDSVIYIHLNLQLLIQLLLTPGITKKKLWKVKGILKNKSSRNSYDVLELQKTPIYQSTVQLLQLSEASTERRSLKIVVIKFLEINERRILLILAKPL